MTTRWFVESIVEKPKNTSKTLKNSTLDGYEPSDPGEHCKKTAATAPVSAPPLRLPQPQRHHRLTRLAPERRHSLAPDDPEIVSGRGF